MATINSYPTATPTGSDLIIGTDTSTTPNSTKTFTIDSINALAPTSVAGATAYIASWTQTGSTPGNPVPVEIFNNTGATFTWARTDTGRYSITASSAVFTADKTFYNIQGAGNSAETQFVQPTNISTTVALYRQITTSGSYSDGNSGWVEIRIHP
jgi:hypothetical protein